MNKLFDFTQLERSAKNVERALRAKGVPPLQRAVLTLLLLHPRAERVEDCRKLTISLRDAAAWLRENVPGCTDASHSGVSRSIDTWIERGVLAVVTTGQRRTAWLATDNLKTWHDLQPDIESLPDFLTPDPDGSDARPEFAARQLSPAVSDCLPLSPTVSDCNTLSPGVAGCCVVLRGVASQRGGEKEEEENIETSPHPSLNQAALSALTIPDDIWTAKSDRGLFHALKTFLHAEQLHTRFPDQPDLISQLTGLILSARRARDPCAYFATCLRSGLRPHLTDTGRLWIHKMRRETAPAPK